MKVPGLNIIYWYIFIYAGKELTTMLTSVIFRHVTDITLTTLGLSVRFFAILTTHNCILDFFLFFSELTGTDSIFINILIIFYSDRG